MLQRNRKICGIHFKSKRMVLEEISTFTQQLWTFAGIDESRECEKRHLKGNEMVTTIAGYPYVMVGDLL